MGLTRRKLVLVADELEASFDADDEARFRARYNVAPTDLHWLLVLDEAGRRRIVPGVWGLPSPKRPVINVRGESVRRGALRGRTHGLAIADGFYEWLREGKTRRPFWYHRPDDGLLLLATVDEPLTGSARAPTAFAVLTVAANGDTAPVHDRMPALIPAAQADAWLRGPGGDLLAPAPDGTVVATEVSAHVNRVANDDPACIAPLPTPPATSGSRRSAD
jgi:putative SOS response-associated peptidase YedK